MTRTCTLEDCDKGLYAKGYCNKHWQRFNKFGDPLDTVPPGHRRCLPPLPELPEAELGWLAGLLEGEGSFFMSNGSNKSGTYKYPQISVEMTDLDVIQRVARIFGVSTYTYDNKKRPNEKIIHKAIVSGSKATELMEQLLPWMGERRSQKIRELLKTKSGKASL
jgi:hypothetical protein